MIDDLGRTAAMAPGSTPSEPRQPPGSSPGEGSEFRGVLRVVAALICFALAIPLVARALEGSIGSRLGPALLVSLLLLAIVGTLRFFLARWCGREAQWRAQTFTFGTTAIVLVVAVIGTGARSATDRGPQRDESGAVVEAGDVKTSELRVGDCFDNPEQLLEAPSTTARVGDVTIVPCDQPHDREVFATVDVEGLEFPGDEALRVQAVTTCATEFEKYAAEHPGASPGGIAVLRPGQNSWSDGDRTVTCALDTTDTERDASGAVIEPGDVSATKLRVGDCFDNPEDYATAIHVPAVPCDQPHDNEVFAISTVEGDEFPGDVALGAQAQTICAIEFEAYAARRLDVSPVGMTWLVPLAENWRFGDRSVTCLLDRTDTERDALGAVVETGDISFVKLRVGDCFNDPDDYAAALSVPAVPCDQPHDNEVFARFEIEGDEFPGDEALEAQTRTQCEEELDSYLGQTPDRSDLVAFPFQPEEETWKAGDRQITCALYNADLSPLTGSMKADN